MILCIMEDYLAPGKVEDGVMVRQPLRLRARLIRIARPKGVGQLGCAIHNGHEALLVPHCYPLAIIEARHLRSPFLSLSAKALG